MKGQRVLVTGAGGFIGSHLVQALLERGAKVRALLRYKSDGGIGNLQFLSADALAEVQLVHGDLTDAEFVLRLVANCDAIFHLGALVAIPYSYSAPRSYVTTNIDGTLNILEAARACETPRLVHTSTSEVYGSARYIPMDEAHPLQAQSPYAATKIAADKLVESYAGSFGLKAVILRPFNTFGPRQSARAVIPTVIGQALGGGPVIRLGATAPIRDLTYVTDTVAGFMAAATANGIVGGCYNLGTGTGIAIGDLARVILREMGVDARIEMEAQRLRPAASEVERLISCHDAFTEATGWRPEVHFEDGIRRTIAFFRQRPELLPAGGYAQ
jgi:NAD dependent epimerase/dehydratase